jgi:hypothetical protein
MKKRQKENLEPFCIRIEPSVKAALEHAAADDSRQLADLIRVILKTWLIANGWMKGKS